MSENQNATFEQEDEGLSLLDLLQIIVENVRLLVLGPLAAGLLVFAYSFTITPSFTAKTQFLPPQQQQSAAASMIASLGSLGGFAGAAAGLKNPADLYLAYLKSVTLQNALIERFKLQERYKAKTKGVARAMLSGRVRAVAGKDGLISLEADDKDPQFAADLANAHVEELRNLLGKMAVTEAQQRRLFFEKQLSQAKDNLTAAELALKATGISSSVLKSNPASAVAAVAGLKAQVTAQEVRVGAMRGYLAETAPEFKQAMSELANLRSQLAKQEKDESINPLSSNNGVAKDNGDYLTKYRDYKYQENLFEIFTRQFEVAKVDESREGAVIQVLDRAEAPENKTKPKKARMAIMATLVAGLAFLLFVFIRHSLRNINQNPETSQKMANLKTSWRKAWGLNS